MIAPDDSVSGSDIPHLKINLNHNTTETAYRPEEDPILQFSEDRRLTLQYKTQRFQKMNSGRGFKSKVSKNLSAEHNFRSTTKSAFAQTLTTASNHLNGALTCAGFTANTAKISQP
jgi:hypothetical protein